MDRERKFTFTAETNTFEAMEDKKFDEWNHSKKQVNARKNRLFFHEREIWFSHLGKNIGHEQDGGSEFLRPVTILKKFNQRLFWGIPLTTKKKEGKFYFTVTDEKDKKIRVALLSQLRLMDVNRLKTKIGMISLEEFSAIKKAIQRWLD